VDFRQRKLTLAQDDILVLRAVMDERIRFITHQGKRILLIDLSQCSAEEIVRLLPEIQDVMTSEPRDSVLALGDFTNAQVRRETADHIKKTLVFDRPHVKRAAWVGTEKIPRVFMDAFKNFSQRDLPTFKTREEALDWLVK
jgi:hypothetical protein